MYITADTIITAASLITALTVIGGCIMWVVRFMDRQKRQDEELREIRTKELDGIRRELSMVCYGLLACLKGLKEQGCDGPVEEALTRLEKYLNNQAHDQP